MNYYFINAGIIVIYCKKKTMSSLSEEQRRRMEESKRKALALRAAKQKAPTASSTTSSNGNVSRSFYLKDHAAVKSREFVASTNNNLSNVARSFGTFGNSVETTCEKPSLNNAPHNVARSFCSSVVNNNKIVQGSSAPANSNAGCSSFYSTSKKLGNDSSTVLKTMCNVQYSSSSGGTDGQRKMGSLQMNQKNSCQVANLQALVTQSISPMKSGGPVVKGICRLVSQERFMVDVRYNAALVEVFKSMETKSYDPKTKNWTFHLSEYTKLIQHINALGSQFLIEPLAKSVTSAFSAALQGKMADRQVPDADLSRVDAKLVDALLPFQRHGVNFVIHRQGRALIADDMGLGKTLQALCVLAYYRSEWPALIVVPSSVRFAWSEQILEWLPSVNPQDINVVVTGKESSTSGRINIISYDLMVKRKKELHEKRFKVVIMDESHSLKNVKTARTQAALPLLKGAKRVLLLSGTPALSRPNELFTQISAIDPSVFPKFHDFGVRYCDGKKHPWGWDFSGSSNLAELQLILEEKIMIRRLKSEVMSQLPSKTRQVIVLDPSSVKVNKMMKNSHKLVTKLKGTERRGALLEYFHETGGSKAPAVREYVLDLLENDRKLLLFAHHQEVLDVVEEAVMTKKYSFIRIDGRTNSEQRTYLANKFQNDDRVKIAILSIAAANSGINLTAASLVVFAELFWNPGILMQAEDRAHRIGQEDNVTIHYLVAKGTADDYLWPLVQQKLEVLGKAGLSKDDFSSADTRVMQDPKQREIMEFFEQTFLNDHSEEMQEGVPTASVSENQECTSNAAKSCDGQQSNLFNYFQPKIDSKPKTDSKIPHVSGRCGIDKSGQGNTISSDLELSNSKQGTTGSSNNDLRHSTESEVTSQSICAEGSDWLDELDEEFWEQDLDPDAPWPPPDKKSRYC